jgi:hypothetical protein
LSWGLPLQFLLLLLLLLSALRNRVDSNLRFLALTLGAEKFQVGFEKLADFEKSGGHEKSCRF